MFLTSNVCFGQLKKFNSVVIYGALLLLTRSMDCPHVLTNLCYKGLVICILKAVARLPIFVENERQFLIPPRIKVRSVTKEVSSVNSFVQ